MRRGLLMGKSNFAAPPQRFPRRIELGLALAAVWSITGGYTTRRALHNAPRPASFSKTLEIILYR